MWWLERREEGFQRPPARRGTVDTGPRRPEVVIVNPQDPGPIQPGPLSATISCSKPRRFMAKGTGKPGRSSGSRGSAPRRTGYARLMREHHLQAPHRAGHAHGPATPDGTITTAAPDVMWGTDMTTTVTVGEGPASVFVAVDHCTTECIGLHAAKRGNRFEALEPIR